MDRLYNFLLVKPFINISTAMRNEWVDKFYHGVVTLSVAVHSGLKCNSSRENALVRNYHGIWSNYANHNFRLGQLMMLLNLILILLIGGAIAWWSERLGNNTPRLVAVVVLIVDFLYLLSNLIPIPVDKFLINPNCC